MGGSAQIVANLPNRAVGLRARNSSLPRKGVETIACYTKAGRVGGTAQIVANLPNRARAGLRACETHHYLVRAFSIVLSHSSPSRKAIALRSNHWT